MNGTVLTQVHKFNYLGSLITFDGRCINEIKRSMAQAKASFQNMKSILTNKRLSLGVRKRVLQCYIEPILLYGRRRGPVVGHSLWTRPARVQSPWEARIIRCKNLALYIRDCESLCLSDETVKAVGPFYLVSMSGEVKDPTQGVNV